MLHEENPAVVTAEEKAARLAKKAAQFTQSITVPERDPLGEDSIEQVEGGVAEVNAIVEGADAAGVQEGVAPVS